MSIRLSIDAVNHVYAAQARLLTGDAQLMISKTQARIVQCGSLLWQVESTKASTYSLYILYSAKSACNAVITVNGSTHNIVLPATRGYFSMPESNFERIETGVKLKLATGLNNICIELTGPCALSSLELATPAACAAVAAASAAMQCNRASIKPYAKGYGFMFHWVAQSMPRSGMPIPYRTAVDLFDAESFADTVADAGGHYVFFTTNHMYPHFPAPLAEWEQRFPNMTTPRDLIADIGVALEKRGIALMLYVNFTSALYADDAVYGESAQLTDFACSIFNSVGRRYGKLLKGWWVDSCYQLDRQFICMDFAPLLRASKEGNAKRITTFNYWILPTGTPYMDFWAGEVCDTIKLPDHELYGYGCAPSLPPHALLLMEDNWWHDKRDTPIIAPRFPAAHLADFIQGMNARGGMVTINLQIYQDGGIGDITMDEMRKLKQLVY